MSIVSSSCSRSAHADTDRAPASETECIDETGYHPTVLAQRKGVLICGVLCWLVPALLIVIS